MSQRLMIKNMPISKLSTFAAYTRAFNSLTAIHKLVPPLAPSATTNVAGKRQFHYASRSKRVDSILQARTFSTTIARKVHDTTQVAPSAKAYLESGVIAGSGNLVDVNKVLVIGSGGLSIGQAGEFDYSGKF